MSFISELKELISPTDESSKLSSENPNFVTRPNRILHMLRTLQDSSMQISVVIGAKDEYPSKIFGITKHGIILDQLNSREGHQKIAAGVPVQIKAKQQAVPFNFHSTVIKTHGSNLGGYLISLPEKIYYPQKRAFFRVPLEHYNHLVFKAALEFSDNTLTGHILDISSGGISLGIYTTTYLKRGSSLTPVSLTIENTETIICDLNVCSVKKSPHDGLTRVGAEFINLDSATRLALNKFIATYERKRAKKESEEP